MWEQLKRIIKPNWAIVLFWSEPFSSALRMSNIKQYKYDIIWKKEKISNFLLSKKQIWKIHENISIFYAKQPTYNPLKDKRKTFNEFDIIWDSYIWKWLKTKYKKDDWWRLPNSIVEIKRDRGTLWRFHPTQKPVALMEYLIKTYTQEGETVLDFTAGSFTTAVACENTNRKWICIEQDETYFNIWIKRLWY